MRVLEFGAGGSSIFFLKKGVELFSIEHEEKWIIEVKNEFLNLNLVDGPLN